jgi:formylglycine-generating enzyme required for sulfatase activity
MICILTLLLLSGCLIVALPNQSSAVGQENDRKEFTNSIGMKFVWIRPGTFIMGSPANEEGRSNHETQFRVKLTKGFFLGVHSVTQKQWRVVMGDNPSQFKGDDLPVDSVSWNDCQEFVKKLSAKEGKRYRLPTEAEWEFACRAGTTTPFFFGETISTDQANYIGDYIYGKGKKGIFRKTTTPPDTFKANAWGVQDMHGNVWQYCLDSYGPYPVTDLSNPENHVKDHLNDKNETARVLRGGSWNDGPRSCRAACRLRVVPGERPSVAGCRICLPAE